MFPDTSEHLRNRTNPPGSASGARGPDPHPPERRRRVRGRAPGRGRRGAAQSLLRQEARGGQHQRAGRRRLRRRYEQQSRVRALSAAHNASSSRGGPPGCLSVKRFDFSASNEPLNALQELAPEASACRRQDARHGASASSSEGLSDKNFDHSRRSACVEPQEAAGRRRVHRRDSEDAEREAAAARPAREGPERQPRLSAPHAGGCFCLVSAPHHQL